MFHFQRVQQRRGKEFIDNHPQLANKTPEELSYLVPLLLHNVAGPYSKKESVYSLSVGSIFGKGSEKESTFLVATWRKVATMSNAREPLWREHGWFFE